MKMDMPVKTFAAVLTFSLAGPFQIGFHEAVYNQPQAVMEAFIAQSLSYQFGQSATDYVAITWSVVISFHAVGTLIGAFFLQDILDICGRKTACYMAALVTLIGSFLQILAYVFNLFELLMFGRLFCGIAGTVGIYSCIIFASEVAPRNFRGVAGAISHSMMVIAMIATNLLGFPKILGTKDLWPYMFVVDIGIISFFLGLAWMFPESPKHLLINKNQPILATESLAFYNGPGSDLESLLNTIAAENHGVDFVASKWRILNFPKFLKTHRAFLWSTLVSNLICLAFCFCGHLILLNFLVFILRNAGVNEDLSRYASVCYFLVELLFSCFGAWLIESRGRRSMLLTGAWTTLACLTVIFLCQTIEENNAVLGFDQKVLGAVSVAAILVHATGKAPLGYVGSTMTAELFPSAVRASSIFYCDLLSMTTGNIIVSTAYLPLEEQVGSFALLILLIMPLFVICVALTALCPETKGRDVSDIIKETMSNGSVSKKKQECEAEK